MVIIENACLERMPLVVVHLMEDLHVQDSREDGSESNDRQSHELPVSTASAESQREGK